MPQPVQHRQVRPHHHPRSTSAQQSSLERHRRKCAVCHHPERESIEEEFLHWHNPVNIVHEFDLGDRRILYRHAHATGLYDVRRRNYLFTIENILECGDDIEFTAAAYIKAVRAYACLCDTVRWTEPATRVHHDYHVHTDSSGHNNRSRESSPGTDSVAVPSSSLPQAAVDNPARSAPPRAEATTADGTPCGSGRNLSRPQRREPRHNALPAHPSTRERTEGRGLSSTPLLATDSCGSASRAGKDSASSSSLLPLAAVDNPARSAILIARATDHDSRVTGHSPLPSNRQIPELESPVTPTKQTPEAISNRHKFTK